MSEVSCEVVIEASVETVRRVLRELPPGPEPHLAFAWRGRARVRGLFDGEIEITLEALEERRTRLRQTERFSGMLNAFVSAQYYDRARRDLEAANLAVKAWAEELEAGPPAAVAAEMEDRTAA
jgi:hypothetical protein